MLFSFAERFSITVILTCGLPGAGVGKAISMKHTVSKLVAFAALLILCALSVFFLMKRFGGKNTSPVAENASLAESTIVEEDDVSDADSTPIEEPGPAGETVSVAEDFPVAADAPAAEPVSASDTAILPGSEDAVAEAPLPAGKETKAAEASAGPSASGVNPAAASAERSALSVNSSGSTSASPSVAARQQSDRTERWKDSLDAALSNGADSQQYFEYQVITVPKKNLAAAAESLGLPKDSPPTDELLPAIYKVGGYRVIGYSAGYSAASTPVEFTMTRSEFFPSFYILPNDGTDESGLGNGGQIPPPDMDEEEDGSGDSDDGEYDDEGEDDDGEDGEDGFGGFGNFNNSYNNLASILPFFGDPTPIGNEFFLDIRPPRIFMMESSMRKLNGFTNTDYGDWGNAQSPVFDDNSFSSTLAATRGKPMIVAKSQTSNAWTLHVFFTQAMPMPERLVPAAESENKLVRLDFQIVRVRWNELCSAGGTDGCPAVPADTILEKLSSSTQLRDLYSPSFRLIPSQEPVAIQLNTKTQFVPLKWLPAQDLGIPAIPLDSGSIWTGTELLASARVFNDGQTVRLDYRFEKTSQTGWRNYGYSYYGEPEELPVQNRYARPMQAEPEILTGLLKLPMLDTTAFRQALYLEPGKPVLAARISNPAYQPDMLTLLFVTAFVEDAP